MASKILRAYVKTMLRVMLALCAIYLVVEGVSVSRCGAQLEAHRRTKFLAASHKIDRVLSSKGRDLEAAQLDVAQVLSEENCTSVSVYVRDGTWIVHDEKLDAVWLPEIGRQTLMLIWQEENNIEDWKKLAQ